MIAVLLSLVCGTALAADLGSALSFAVTPTPTVYRIVSAPATDANGVPRMQAIVLQEGQKAPFTGILLTPERAEHVATLAIVGKIAEISVGPFVVGVGGLVWSITHRRK